MKKGWGCFLIKVIMAYFISLILCPSVLVYASFTEETGIEQHKPAELQELSGTGYELMSPVFLDMETAAAYVRRQMEQRMQNIELCIRTSEDICSLENFSSFMTAFMEKIGEHTSSPTQGDYLQHQRKSVRYSIKKSSFVNGNYYNYLTFTVSYQTTAEQENTMNAEVQRVLDELDLEGKSDYEKVRCIYKYICDNVTYDYENLDDNTYELKYTAYAALINKTAVCEGYALLLYRLMMESGIDCRLITGGSTQGGYCDHAWNIVRIGEKYYNLDSTWDADNSSGGFSFGWMWFLYCDNNFPRHYRSSEYTTEEFQAMYPMSENDYDRSSPVVNVTNIKLDQNKVNLEANKSVFLKTSLIPANASNTGLSWVSDNTTVAAVSKYGEVIALKPGIATITVTTEDGNKTAICSVTVKIVGDVNGDGVINRTDRTYLARYLANWSGYTLADEMAADVNRDGIVNRADRTYLARYLANWEGYMLED